MDEATARALAGPLYDQELFVAMADENGMVTKQQLLDVATPEDMKLEAKRRAAILASEEFIRENEQAVKKLQHEEAVAIDNLEQMELDTALRDEVAALREEKKNTEVQLEDLDEHTARKAYLKVKESLDSVTKRLNLRQRALDAENAIKAKLKQAEDAATAKRKGCEDAITARKLSLKADVAAQMRSGGERLLRIVKPTVKEKDLNWSMNRVFVKIKVTDVPWDGVTFDSRGEISSINLMSVGMDVDIAVFSAYFPHTPKFDLSGNDNVRGNISCVGNFVHLEYLDLGYTRVGGDLSIFRQDAERRAEQLEKQLVAGKRRVEDATDEIKRTRKLMQETPPDTDSYREMEHDVAEAQADIDGIEEQMRDVQLKIHEACPPLAHLDLQCTDVTGTLESLCRNVKLEFLLLSNTVITGSIETFRHCHLLKEVRLAQNNVTGSIQVFGNCRSLETCDLRCTRVNGSKKSLEEELPLIGGRVFL